AETNQNNSARRCAALIEARFLRDAAQCHQRCLSFHTVMHRKQGRKPRICRAWEAALEFVSSCCCRRGFVLLETAASTGCYTSYSATPVLNTSRHSLPNVRRGSGHSAAQECQQPTSGFFQNIVLSNQSPT